ncbi:hypothetical protein AALP_AA8G028900 [Arabis alpina]|uniref:DUF1985 domain-containing protein n=1 Tax=Arabis alpina TaxID=50452 RepID=A0A087G4L7_ARAAL|nr:hypothetical protein AALP_AA8G028900 [Arabis alpina]
MEDETRLETQNWDECLPPRLFATDRYPDTRLNIYSKTQNLASNPRHVLTKKKYELWTVFGGHALRFPLAEFGYITGIDCGDFPEKYKPNHADEITAADVPYWRKLIGDNFDASLEDIHEMLLSSDDMPGWRRLGLALILLVDGVLIARHQKQRTVPTPKYVAMLEDVEAFMCFPWGRETFLRIVKCMVPAQPQSPPVSKRKKVVREEDPVADLQKKLQQQTVHLEGFPLALQLLALEAIPALLSLTPDPRDLRTLSDTEATEIPKQIILNIEQVRGAENNPKELSGHEEAAEGRGIPSEMVGESPDVMVVDSTECTGPKNVRNSEAVKSVIVETSPEGVDIDSANVKAYKTVPVDVGGRAQSCVGTFVQGMDIDSSNVKAPLTTTLDVSVAGQTCGETMMQGMDIDYANVKASTTVPVDVGGRTQSCVDTFVQELEGQEEAEEGRVSPIVVLKEGVVDMVIDSANADASKTKPGLVSVRGQGFVDTCAQVSAGLVLDDDNVGEDNPSDTSNPVGDNVLVAVDLGVESDHRHVSKAIDTAKSVTPEVQSCVVDIVVDPSIKGAECVKVSSPAEETDCYIPSAEDQLSMSCL